MADKVQKNEKTKESRGGYQGQGQTTKDGGETSKPSPTAQTEKGHADAGKHKFKERISVVQRTNTCSSYLSQRGPTRSATSRDFTTGLSLLTQNYNQVQHGVKLYDIRNYTPRARGCFQSAHQNARKQTSITKLHSPHPLSSRIEQLVIDSDSNVVLALANSENKFEHLLKEKLGVEKFKLILKLLSKVCQSGYDKNKMLILTQACNSEFLDQFMNLLIQGIKLMMPANELSQLVLDMLKFFEEVLILLPLTACDKLKSTANGCHACIDGLAKEGTITIDQNVLEKFKTFLDDLDKVKALHGSNCNIEKESKKELMNLVPPPNDFRDINIYPNIEDLARNVSPFLRPNVVNGAYQSVEHYLDVQYRLLREDYIRPLREGIDNFMKGNSTKKRESYSVRVYKGIKFLKYINEENEKGQKTREGTLIKYDASCFKNVDLQNTKRFMYGSLLCFSRNNFETILFATVVERSYTLLSKGQLLVKFCENYEENIYDSQTSYIMIENEVFFEPYYQVLKTLKTMNETSFPMQQYIVEMQQSTSPPKYLATTAENPQTKYVVRNGRKKFNLTVLDKSTWPSAEDLGLDQSQYIALQAALTQELAVIQGPPGTGKTFMALKIAQTLIENQECTWQTETTPILVVCLTNHALDQFLGEILKVTKNIVRVGGQSKSEEMTPYNLRNLKRSGRLHSDLFRNLSEKMKHTKSEMTIIERDLELIKDNKGIVSPALLTDIVADRNILGKLNRRYLSWLSGLKLNNENTIMTDEKIVTFGALKRGINMYEENNFKDLQYAFECEEIDIYQRENLVIQVKMEADFMLNAIYKIEHQLKSQEIPISEKQVQWLLGRNDIWSLNIVQRWQLYTHWVRQCEQKLQNYIRKCENRLFSLNERLDKIRFQDNLRTLQDACVVGMTTTGAARLHGLLKLLRCQIVIVEEAAEVIESHVVACLTNDCNHLILIGDHKQLRPSIAVYELGRHYNFDVSLFERMVRNRGQCLTLGVQHRMAPAMAKLIVPTIYPSLYNAKSVLERPEIHGIPHRLFFIEHTEPEQQDTEMSSRRNEYEAHFLLALCHHLVLQGYKSHEITILATYRGQMFYMKKLQRREENVKIKEVEITVVDNFQGEENEIILLSLVRSNDEGRIGFLATENRVCVALSRSRQGLYIIGNMEILAAASKTWKAVQSSLVEQAAIGEALSLRCQVHPEQTCKVSKVDDFRKFSPQGGCTKICSFVLSCGHTCDNVCHSLDQEHSDVKCQKPCKRKCAADLHPCKKKCFTDCGDCAIKVNKTLLCGHEHEMDCFVNPADYKCYVMVEKKFEDCSHRGTVQCFDTKCSNPCEIRLQCGHQCVSKCHINSDPDHLEYKCFKNCTKLNKGCSQNHECQKMCHEECDLCSIKVLKKKKCGHVFEMTCVSNPEIIQCKMKCKKTLHCGHWCKRRCYEKCDPCVEEVTKTIETCGHTLKTNCSSNVSRKDCIKNCERMLNCGHKCKELCANDCTKKCKEKVEMVLADCGHEVPLLCWEKAEGLSKPDNMERCQNPCNKLLGCKHRCKGNCSSCMQGRFHVPCQEPCKRVLVCGHICKAVCNIVCPPCEEKCTKRCNHSKCDNVCGDPCQPCKQKCQWRCEHFRCTQKCSMPCNRPPCNEPCKKKLPCGHLCAGLCGEVCPKLCWECDKERLLSESMELAIDSPLTKPRFVVLPDCYHIIEVASLERWLAWQNTSVSVRTCPRCDTPITKFYRYRTHSMQVYQEFSYIKSLLFKQTGHYQQQKIKESINQLKTSCQNEDFYQDILKYLNTAEASLKPLGNMRLQRPLLSMLTSMNTKSLDIQISLISNMCSVLQVCISSKENRDALKPIISFMLNMLEKRKKNLGLEEAVNFNLEILRLQHLSQGLQILEQNIPNKRDMKEFCDHTCLKTQYSKKMQEKTQTLLSKMTEKSEIKFDFTPINIKVPIQQVKSFWIKCPNDHLNFKKYFPLAESWQCEKCDAIIKERECPIFNQIQTDRPEGEGSKGEKKKIDKNQSNDNTKDNVSSHGDKAEDKISSRETEQRNVITIQVKEKRSRANRNTRRYGKSKKQQVKIDKN